MILGIGSDLCDIRRIEKSLERHAERFTHRLFTETERAKAEGRAHRAATYAKRFAAKEACAKALGTGIRRGVFWKDMGVVNLPSGAPTMALTGGAAERLKAITPGRPPRRHPPHHHRRSPLGTGLHRHRGAARRWHLNTCSWRCHGAAFLRSDAVQRGTSTPSPTFLRHPQSRRIAPRDPQNRKGHPHDFPQGKGRHWRPHRRRRHRRGRRARRGAVLSPPLSPRQWRGCRRRHCSRHHRPRRRGDRRRPAPPGL